MTKTIQIACAADINYFRFIPSMLNSVRKHTQATLQVGVFTQSVDQKYKDQLSAIFPEINFHFWDISEETFKGLPHRIALSPMSYARVLMADMSGWDKFIYLDLDIVALSDLIELYETDIADNYVGACYVAGAINAGVLLINGKAWRENDIKYKVLEYATNYQPKEADQEAIEHICHNKIAVLNQKWNVVIDAVWGRVVTLNPAYYRNAAITHYITGFKPWNLGYYLLPKELKLRWKAYEVKTDFPINLKREATLYFYQFVMLVKVFVINKIKSIVFLARQV
jgi:lipopolysaccharide biosynthesis glycosyltransferase